MSAISLSTSLTFQAITLITEKKEDEIAEMQITPLVNTNINEEDFFSFLYPKNIDEFANIPDSSFQIDLETLFKEAPFIFNDLEHIHDLEDKTSHIIDFCEKLSEEEFSDFLTNIDEGNLDEVSKELFIDKEVFIANFKKMIREFSCGVRPENTRNNRYRDIFPNNATRVKLSDGKYYNGNECISGRVIVCQGPKEKEFHLGNEVHGNPTFFQMIWENDSSAIAMVTNYVENGVPKCARYLPGSATHQLMHGPYSVKAKEIGTEGLSSDGKERLALKGITLGEGTLEALRKEGVKVSELEISKDGEVKTVIHSHITNWEDKKGGTATAVAASARFLLDMEKPVIHCSAGIGRAGTVALVMAVYLAALEYLKKGEPCPQDLMPKTLASLRQERGHAVQTFDQYEVAYDAVKILFGLPLVKSVNAMIKA